MAIAHKTQQNPLRKAGADIRWFLEQQGVNPEKCTVVLCVRGEIDELAVRAAFHYGYHADQQLKAADQAIVSAEKEIPDRLTVHGVRFCVVQMIEASDGKGKSGAAARP